MPFQICRLHSTHKKRISALAFSARSATIASADVGGTVILWDPETSQEKARILTEPYEGKDDVVTALCFHPREENSLFIGCMSGLAFHYRSDLVGGFFAEG